MIIESYAKLITLYISTTYYFIADEQRPLTDIFCTTPDVVSQASKNVVDVLKRYSLRKLFAGFVRAALTLWLPIVRPPMINKAPKQTPSVTKPMSMW